MTNEDAIILLKDCIRLFENGKYRTAEDALVYLICDLMADHLE